MKTIHIEESGEVSMNRESYLHPCATLTVTHDNGTVERMTMVSNAAISCFNKWISEGYMAVWGTWLSNN